MKDSERTRLAACGATASVGFDGYMARVDVRCTHLTLLLDLRDLDGVVDVARSAVKLSLLGCDACRALVELDGTKGPAARQRLETSYAQLLNVLTRAYTALAGHPTRNTLDDLRTQLVTAAAALDSDPATTAKAPAADD